MKASTTILLLFLLCNTLVSYGQGENNIWCFGTNTGLDFNAGPPVLYPSAMDAFEGCTSICDASGSLIFYTSTSTVFDRNNNVMPNGSGLIGNSSSTMGAAIVQSNSDPNQYYLFTMTDIAQHTNSLHYSIIDMTLNGGLGDVVVGQKNILLDNDVEEKMVVARGAGCYTWLIVHHYTNPEFHVFKIDASGLDVTPIVSTSGFCNVTNGYTRGEMKISPNDSNIALVNYENPWVVELHSFNNTTGVVSNAIDLDTIRAYGVSYSPDGSKLYVPTYSGNPAALYQYDLSLLPDVQAVKNSKTVIASQHFNGLRIGPDNKIYVAYFGNISVINNPNLAGPACNLQTNVFSTGVQYFLGNAVIPNSMETTTYHSRDTAGCLYFKPMTLTAPNGYTDYVWSDGNTGQTDTAGTAGTKWVTSAQFCTVRIDTFHVTETPAAINSIVTDTSACFVLTAPILTAPAGDSYIWSDGFTVQQDTIGSPGSKWVLVNDTSACSVLTDTFKVHAKLDTTTASTDTTHCVAYSAIPITAPGGYTSYLWSDGITLQTDTFFSSTTKWVQAQNGCGLLIDTIHFTATNIPQDSTAMFGKNTTVCFDHVTTVNVTGPPGYTYYLWNDGTTQQSNAFNGPGIKWVYAQKLCDLIIDTFTVTAQVRDTSIVSNDTTVCFSSQVSIYAPGGYVSYLWSDGGTNQSTLFSTTGSKYVYMQNECATGIDTFHVNFINDLGVDLGNDTSICEGKTMLLDATSTYPDATYQWQDSSSNATYTVTKGGDYSVRVHVGPCSIADDIRIRQSVVVLDARDGLIPCHGESTILDAGSGNAYLWQDGSTDRTFVATKNGSYYVVVTQGVCSDTATIHVKTAECPCAVILPDAFSPNNDGKNDYFGMGINCGVREYELMVYDRWGNRVFSTESLSNKWDGTYNGVQLDAGVYYYYAHVTTDQLTSYQYKGSIILIR